MQNHTFFFFGTYCAGTGAFFSDLRAEEITDTYNWRVRDTGFDIIR
jgi:hypothetical protein